MFSGRRVLVHPRIAITVRHVQIPALSIYRHLGRLVEGLAAAFARTLVPRPDLVQQFPMQAEFPHPMPHIIDAPQHLPPLRVIDQRQPVRPRE